MQTTKDLLLTYVRYNLWANKALAELSKTIDPNWIETEIKSSFPSIRKSAFHIWDAEYIWLARFKGTSLSSFPSKTLPADTDVFRFTEGAQSFVDFVETQDDSFFTGTTTFKDMAGTEYTMDNSGMLMHCMNHSSFHRGQIVTMLRQLGFTGEMPRTDLIVYLRELSR